MIKVSIIIPIYNGEKYIEKLVKKIKNQKGNFKIEIILPVSKSQDKSYKSAKKFGDIVYKVEEFNHAKTRHEAVLKAKGEVLVFMTQDVLPFDEYWLKNLIEPLSSEKKIIATYSRQIAYPDSTETEKLIREFNYPSYDRLCNESTKEKWGRKNIFYSDASSATIKEEFLKIGGYDFDVVTNEDVLYALNAIKDGKSILYNSKSKVYHSHDFEFKSIYSRYKMIGEFEREFVDQLSEYSSMGEGGKLLKFLIKELIKKGNFKELFLLSIDCGVRYVAYKKGKKK